MTHAPFRLLRASLLGGAIVALAAAAHVLAGGLLPAPVILLALAALVLLASTAAAALRLRLPALLALLGAGQWLLHHALSVLSAPTPLAGSPSPGPHTHGSAEQAASAALQAMSWAAADTAALHHELPLQALSTGSALAAGMLPAHLVATVATAVLLARGEAAWWALAGWLRPVRRLPAPLALPPRPAPHTVVAALVLTLPWRNERPDTRRGPPLLAASA